MKGVIALVLFLNGCSVLNAQSSLPPAFALKSDTIEMQEIDNNYWQSLDDTDAKWKIEAVIAPPLSEKFSGKKPGQTPAAIISNTHWVRYRIKNQMPGTARISFYTESQQADFYVFRNNDLPEHFTTGSNYPWSQKDGLKKANAIPWELKAGEEVVVYQRRFNESPDSLGAGTKLRLYSTDKLMAKEFKSYETGFFDTSSVFRSFISGMFLLAAIFNFLLFRELKERETLYFSLFLFCLFVLYAPFFAGMIGRENPRLGELFNSIGLSFIFFFLFFVRNYFKVYERFPKWDKLLSILSMLFVITVLIGWITHGMYFTKFVWQFRLVVLIFFMAAIAITIILSIRKPVQNRTVFLVAITPFLFYLFGIIIVAWIIYLLKINISIEVIINYWNYLLGISIVWATIVFSGYHYRNYGEQQRLLVEGLLEKEKLAREKEHERNAFMEQQKIELENQVASRTAELNASLNELKSTQSQLIQSEKMASLGELTAGIAHEIQNPLNFVNNFSEVNAELIHELKAEMEKGNMEEAKIIAGDIAANEEKISQHGKRADSIVKGMLQHSRTSAAVKEPTDLNALADEFLRLAYHGLRARDKSFNATLKTDFDESIGKVNIIPQDIGRVLLNIISNAFYAVNDKRTASAVALAKVEGFDPIVAVYSEKRGDKAVITVKDNGNGIPQKNIDKIFQPFFTTKPTGQGTGLGLSLAYDIIKAHGGDLIVESKEGEGATFSILLPIT